MSVCKVIDIRRHTGYFGAGNAQEWADSWRAWVRGEVECIEKALKAGDLDEVMQAVGGLVRQSRSEWRSEEYFQGQWDVERDALEAVGADEALAFVIYWAQHKDTIIYKIYSRLVEAGARLLIKELYDQGLRMRDIDERVSAWRPFDSEIADHWKHSDWPAGLRNVGAAAQLRIEMTRAGQLWKPEGLGQETSPPAP
jgi:hypothetical protein